jgi:hypothetical protein
MQHVASNVLAKGELKQLALPRGEGVGVAHMRGPRFCFHDVDRFLGA